MVVVYRAACHECNVNRPYDLLLCKTTGRDYHLGREGVREQPQSQIVGDTGAVREHHQFDLMHIS